MLLLAHKDFENKKWISKDTLKTKIVMVIKILKIKTDFKMDFKRDSKMEDSDGNKDFENKN